MYTNLMKFNFEEMFWPIFIVYFHFVTFFKTGHLRISWKATVFFDTLRMLYTCLICDEAMILKGKQIKVGKCSHNRTIKM